ncbi:MAG TPA: hypothetical protein VK439_14075, partial [Rubrivivax sp.]|nr:hypothetical protein [Rubrivivax sp.]
AGERFAIKLGLNYLERAILLRGSDATPAVQMANLRRRAILCDGLGLYGPQREALDALLALANEHRDDSMLAFAFAQRSLLNDRQNRSAEAEADARAGAEVAARNDDAVRAALCHGNLAWLEIGRSRSEATAHLNQAMHWAQLARQRLAKWNDGIYEVQMLLVASTLHRRYNDHDARGAALARAVELAAGIRAPRLQTGCLDGLVRWALDRAELSLAAGHIHTLRRLGLEFDLRLAVVQAAHFDGLWHLSAGRPDAALVAGAEALRLARAMAAVPSELLALDLLGEASARLGRWPAAAAYFEELHTRRVQGTEAASTLSARLRRDAARWQCGGSDGNAALQDLLDALQDSPALHAVGSVEFGISALGTAHAVLRSNAHPEAPRVLALALRTVEVELSGHADPAVRQHIGQTLPWMREVLDAAGGPSAGAGCLGL